MKDHNLIPVTFLISVPHLRETVTPVIQDMMKRNLFIQKVDSMEDRKFTFLFVDEVLFHFAYQKTSIAELLDMSHFYDKKSQLVIINFFHWKLDRNVDCHPIFDKFPNMDPDNLESVRETVIEMFQQNGLNIPNNTIYLEFNKMFLSQYAQGTVDRILNRLPDIKKEEIVYINLTEDVKNFLSSMFQKNKEEFESTVDDTVKRVLKDHMSKMVNRLEQKESQVPLHTADAVEWCHKNDLPFTVINMTDEESVMSFFKKIEEIQDLPAIRFFDLFQPYFETRDGVYNRGNYIHILENENIATVLDLLRKRPNQDKLRTQWYSRFLSVLFDNGFYFGPGFEGFHHQQKRSS